jgi:hypothetical protein
MVPLFAVVVAFLVLALWPYVQLDPATSRVPPPPGVPGYYPMLVAHVLAGSIALLTGCLAVWPWLRARRPGAHRALGRVYVFLGVIPGGLLGLVLGAVSPFGPVTQVSNVLLAMLWLGTTTAAFLMARRRRYGEHRRWMVRSVALTLSIIVNRVLSVGFALWLFPQLDTTFGGDEGRLIESVAGLSAWSGWTLSLLAAEWVLQASARRARPGSTSAPLEPAGVR